MNIRANRFRTRHWHSLCWGIAALPVVLLSGCALPDSKEQARSQPTGKGPPKGPIAVDVATAELGSLQQDLQYVGTTAPSRTVALRARLEGQLRSLTVNAGDRVARGQILGRIEDNVLQTQLLEARSELAARKSEVAQAKSRVQELRTQVSDARVQQQQAQRDADRLQSLRQKGAISAQMAEQALTTAQTAAQTVQSAQAQVRTQQQAVSAAQERVQVQQAVINQIQERRSQAVLISPITGQVIERMLEPGSVVQTGDSVVSLGAFSPLKITVQVSELDLATIRVRQVVNISLDAFPERTWNGTVARIPPRADPTARQIPVEILLRNPGGRLTGGLLARVRFVGSQSEQVIVPQTALQVSGGRGRKGVSANGGNPQIFVLNDAVKPPTVSARTVTLGNKRDDQVEIKSGLNPGEAFVVRSARPLKDGTAVRLSILSQPSQRSR